MTKPLETLAERRAWQAIDGAQAMAEYQANVEATLARTALLREARLARDAVTLEPKPQKAKRALTQTKTPPKRGSVSSQNCLP